MSNRGRRTEPVIEEQACLPVLLQSSPEYLQGNRDKLKKSILRKHTLESVLQRSNIELAWKRVRSNKGAAGVDGMKVEEAVL